MRLSFVYILLPFVLLLGASSSPNNYLVGSIIKNALENYHYRKLQINNNLSSKAFDEYLSFIDGGKQYFLQADIKTLEQYRLRMDDELSSNKPIKLIHQSIILLKHRIKQADNLRKKIFKKEFNFSKNEYLELDSKKRKYPKNQKEFNQLWSKIFKHTALLHYISLVEEQKDTKKTKTKTKTKIKKKQSRKQLLKKTNESINKRYSHNFKRLMERDYSKFSEYYYNAIASIFDPHTAYFSPQRKEEFDIDISGKLEGIGAVLQEDGSFIRVSKIIPGGAAWWQKELEADDVILMVAQKDGSPISVIDMPVGEVITYIRGKKGTEVRFNRKKARWSS